LGAAIAVEVWKTVISRVEAVLVHLTAIFRTRPFDLFEHLLRFSEELVAWFVQVHRYNVDWTALAIEGNDSRLEIAVRAVEKVSKIGSGNFSKDDVRLKAFRIVRNSTKLARPLSAWKLAAAPALTAEQYQPDLECDRELFQVIALDAKGIPRSRLTAQQATNLLAEASQIAKAPIEEENASLNKKPSTKRAIKLPAKPVQQLSNAPH
jgi:hypothetical protein